MSELLRVFLSIDIEDELILSVIREIQSRLDRDAAKMKFVEIHNIHFTWRFFGNLSVDAIEKIRLELSTINFAPFEILIQGVGVFPRIQKPRVVWVGVAENSEMMEQLKSKTDSLLSNIGYKKERRKFTPHATIARVKFVRDRQRFVDNLESTRDVRVGTMRVDNIRIKKSTLTPTGPIYETLWEIPLER